MTFGPILRVASAVLGLLAFIGIGLITATILLANTPGPYLPNEVGEGMGLLFALAWPAALAVAWACGTLVLLLDGRGHRVLPFLGMLIAAALAALLVVVLITAAAEAASPGNWFPLRGVPAAALVLSFVALDATDIVYAWRTILRGKLA